MRSAIPITRYGASGAPQNFYSRILFPLDVFADSPSDSRFACKQPNGRQKKCVPTFFERSFISILSYYSISHKASIPCCLSPRVKLDSGFNTTMWYPYNVWSIEMEAQHRNEHFLLRGLTYLDEDDAKMDVENETLAQTAQVCWLSVLSAAFGMMALLNIRVTSASQAFYEWNAIRLILPGIQWVMAMDCATLAVDVGDEHAIASQWAIAVYMLQATVAPGIFVSTFVITFLAYRNRSIPFCMVQRAPGRNSTHLTGNTAGMQADDMEGEGMHDSSPDSMQPLIRPATMVALMRLFSVFCFLIALVVNFDVVWNGDDLAGRTGWASLFRDKWEAGQERSSWHVFLSLLPLSSVACCCFYFSLLLWRYGSFYSMKIYPSVMNPWISPIFGTLCLLGGQCFGPDLFPVMSRTGIWLYQLCFLRVMYEVRHDIKQAGDLGHFLNALGDDYVTGSVAAMEVTASEKSNSRSFQQPKSRDSPAMPSIE